MSLNKIILIAILLVPISVWGRTLRGTVTDERNNPIVYANVVALDRDSAFLAGVVTDSAGMFRFDALPEASAMVRISFVGYADRIVSVTDEDTLGIIRMTESTAMLGEVEVKAGLPKTRVEGDALVTTVAHTVLATAGTAKDVLSKIPLVTESDGKFSVFGAGTPVIYIDGRIVRNTEELSRLSSQDIKSVEVVSNPGEEYSAEADAVIRIRTVPPEGEGFSASLYNSVSVANFATDSGDMLLKYRHKGLEVFFQGSFLGGKSRYHELNSITTYGPEVFAENLDSHITTMSTEGSGKLGFSCQLGENQSLGAYYELGRSKDRTRGTTDTEVTSDGLPYQTLRQQEHGMELTQPTHEANVYYKGTVGKLSIDFNGDYLQTRKVSSDTQDEQGEGTDSRTVYTDAKNRNRLWAEKLVLAYPLWKGTLEAGEEYTNSRIGYDSYYTGADITGGDTRIRESNIAAFARLSQQIGPFRAGLGVRFEHVRNVYSDGTSQEPDLTRIYNNWFPSFTLSGKIKEVGWSLNLTSRTRRPTYRQLDGTLQYVNRYSYRIGNPALKAADRYTAQLMAQWRFLFVQASYTYEKNAVFYTTERYNDDPLVKLVVFENVPKYQHFQVAVGAQPTVGCWSPDVEAGILNGFYTTQFQGERKRLDQPFFFFTWDNSFSFPKDWVVDVDFTAQSAGNAQNCYLKATSCLNLALRKSFFDQRLTVELEANDLFNANNERITMYNGDILTGANNYHESRNIGLSVRYNFNTSRSKYNGTGAGQEEKERIQ